MTGISARSKNSRGAEPNRVLVFGPSGSGTSTLGRALATALASQHFDVDDFYWYPTDPPFRTKRPVPERHKMMEQVFLPRRDWVLSGSISSWAGPVPPRLTYAIRMTLDPTIRHRRLEAREMQRLGHPAQGSPEHEELKSFLSWADGYEAGLRPGRSLSQHTSWAAGLECPVLELDGEPPVEALCEAVLRAIEAQAVGPSPRAKS